MQRWRNNNINLNCNNLNKAATTGTVVISLLLNINGHPGCRGDKISMVTDPDCHRMKCWQPLNHTTGIFPINGQQPRLLHIIRIMLRRYPDCIPIINSTTTNRFEARLQHQKKPLLLPLMQLPISQILHNHRRIFHKPCMSTLQILPV